MGRKGTIQVRSRQREEVGGRRKADTIENGVGNKACDISTCAITKKLGFLVKDFFLKAASRGEYDVEVVLETVRRLLKVELDAQKIKKRNAKKGCLSFQRFNILHFLYSLPYLKSSSHSRLYKISDLFIV